MVRSRRRSASAEASDADSDGGLEHFSGALALLFAHHSASSGAAGALTSFEHARLAAPLRFRVPEHAAGDTGLYAHYQWDAGRVLAALLLDAAGGAEQDTQAASSSTALAPPSLLACLWLERHDAIVELGAGTGLPSLVAARIIRGDLAAARRTTPRTVVVVTDYPSPHLLRALEENVQRERDAPLTSGLPTDGTEGKKETGTGTDNNVRDALDTHVRGLEWGVEEQERMVYNLSPGSSGFSLLLVADCLWQTAAQTALLHSMSALLRRSADARVAVVAGFHTGAWALVRFLQRAAELHLVARAEERWCMDVLRAGSGADGDAWRPWMGDVDSLPATQEEQSRSCVVVLLGWSDTALRSPPI